MVKTPHALGLYFHIPFCQKKCDYCHFYVLPNRKELRLQFLQSLKREWELLLPFIQGKQLISLYFGGGTPALLEPEELEQVMGWIRMACEWKPQVEVTLEANPENVDLKRFQEWVQLGINRISMGVQTLDDALLPYIGRQHTAEQAINAVHTIHEAGIPSLSIDLMYDLPKQSLGSWKRTLDQLSRLPIQHLSLYNLQIEPRSAFFKWRQRIEAEMPEGELSAAMLDEAVKALELMGLKRYEISAFAREGFEAVHNVGYWTARPFFGLGPSAFSYWEGRRERNVEHLGRYARALEEGLRPIDFSEQLEPQASRRELLCIALRLRHGVDLSVFSRDHGPLDEELESSLEVLEKEGFVKRERANLSLTEKGMRFYDYVASELI